MRVEIKAEPKLQAVERATLDHLHALMAMGEAMVQESPWLAHAPYSADAMRKSLSAMLGGEVADRASCVFIVKGSDSPDPIGVLACLEGRYHLWSEERYAQELALYVRPDWRRRGAAEALIAAFEGWAAERGIRHVLIGAGTGIKHEAVAQLYYSKGYRLAHQEFIKHLEIP